MSDPRTLPLPAVFLISGAIACAFALVITTKLAGSPVVPRPTAPIARELDLRFVDQTNGGVAIVDARTQAQIGMLEPGQEGFVRGILRSLARERRANEIGSEPAFQLSQRTDGTLFIRDTATDRAIELDAFGSTNEGAFERLLNLEKAHS